MNIVTQFLSFDKLMGQGLVKIVYFIGLIGIALGCLGFLLSGFGALMLNAGLGLGMIIAAPIFGIFAVCMLRFGCELYIAIFRISEDISAMRAGGGTLPPKT